MARIRVQVHGYQGARATHAAQQPPGLAARCAVSGLGVKVVDRCFLVAYGAAPPTDLEWGAYLALVALHGVDRTMEIVHTDGGLPTCAQRRRRLELLPAAGHVPIAVLAGNARVRAIVTVWGWFHSRLRVFGADELREALAYLQIPASRADLLKGELGTLRRQVSP